MDSLFINKSDNIFLAGHNGLVGSAFQNQLKKDGYKNIFTIDKKNLDLRKEHEVKSYLSQNNFEQAEWHFNGLKVKKSNLSTIASSKIEPCLL